MSSNLKRFLLVLAAGGMLLQTQTCITTRFFDSVDTVLLGGIAVGLYYLAKKA